MVDLVNLNILYEDDDLIAIDKHAGMPVIPERFKKETQNLFMILNTYYLSETTPHYYIVHRIDRDCSGIVLVAKNKNSHKNLCKQFEYRDVQKEYLALVKNNSIQNKGYIDLPIIQRKKGPIRSIISEKGKSSQTSYEVIDKFEDIALLRIIPHTGRPNQIRIHLSAIGHPILCDSLYNKKNPPLVNNEGIVLLNRLALHAYKIIFMQPRKNLQLELKAPLPDDFNNALAFLGTSHDTLALI